MSTAQTTEERLLGIIDTIPLSCMLLDEQGKTIACNKKLRQISGMKPPRNGAAGHRIGYTARAKAPAPQRAEAEIPKGIENENGRVRILRTLYPEYQPDGSRSVEKMQEYVAHAFETGSAEFLWTYNLPDGTQMPAEISMTRIPWYGTYCIIAFTRDLGEIAHVRSEVERQTDLIQTVNAIAQNVVAAFEEDIDHIIADQLCILGRAMSVSRVCLWENHEADGKRYSDRLSEWSENEHAVSDTGLIEVFDHGAYPTIAAIFDKGEIVNVSSNRLPDELRKPIEAAAMRSVMVVPLQYKGAFWGFLEFDNRKNKSSFLDADEQMLRSCGLLLISVIIRSRMTKSLMKAKDDLAFQSKLLRAVNEVSTLLISKGKSDFDLTLQTCVKVLGESMDASQVSFWRNTYQNGVMVSQRLAIWFQGEPFSEKDSGITLPVEDYLPEWARAQGVPPDLELPINMMPETLQNLDFLRHEKQYGRAVLLIPLSIDGEFWGFMGFAHKEGDHDFGEEERSILFTGGVNMAMALIRSETQMHLAEAKADAAYDSLTRLKNRRGFYQHARKIFDSHSESSIPISVLFIDVDHFKDINDEHGHAFGDRVLSTLAQKIQDTIRPCDLICRYGGEEFLVLLSHADQTDGMHVSNRIIKRIRGTAYEEQPTMKTTVSIGVIGGVPAPGDTLENYIHKADRALYQAKNNGRDMVVAF